MTGAGTLDLDAVDTYTGATTMNAGTLVAGAAGAVGVGALSIASGATLDLNNFNQTVGDLSGAGAITLGTATLTEGTADFANRVILDPGAAFTGVVDGGNAIGAVSVSTLELASASATGTLTGFGTEFVNFAQLTVDPGASWKFGGGDALAAGTTLTDLGTLTLNGTGVAGGGAVTIDGTAGLPAFATVAEGGSWSGTSGFVIGAADAGTLLVDTAGSVSASAVDVAQAVTCQAQARRPRSAARNRECVRFRNGPIALRYSYCKGGEHGGCRSLTGVELPHR
jgi:autotransporter-associated beta strand protein